MFLYWSKSLSGGRQNPYLGGEKILCWGWFGCDKISSWGWLACDKILSCNNTALYSSTPYQSCLECTHVQQSNKAKCWKWSYHRQIHGETGILTVPRLHLGTVKIPSRLLWELKCKKKKLRHCFLLSLRAYSSLTVSLTILVRKQNCLILSSY